MEPLCSWRLYLKLALMYILCESVYLSGGTMKSSIWQTRRGLCPQGMPHEIYFHIFWGVFPHWKKCPFSTPRPVKLKSSWKIYSTLSSWRGTTTIQKPSTCSRCESFDGSHVLTYQARGENYYFFSKNISFFQLINLFVCSLDCKTNWMILKTQNSKVNKILVLSWLFPPCFLCNIHLMKMEIDIFSDGCKWSFEKIIIRAA